jgi:hypothetical protein
MSTGSLISDTPTRRHADTPIRRYASLRRHQCKLHRDSITIGERELHLFRIREPLSKDSSFTERSDRLRTEWPRIDLPDIFDFVCLPNEQVDAPSIRKRGTGYPEFCGSASAEFQRKQVPNSNQIAMIRKDLRGNGMLEKRIAWQRFSSNFLMLSLRLQEVQDLGAIRVVSMKSFAQTAEVK